MLTKPESTTSDATQLFTGVVGLLQQVLAEQHVPSTLHEPLFDGNEQKYVAECIQSSWVSSVGSFVDRFESMMAEITGAAQAVAVVNGTAALQLALRLVGVEANDEVLVPALTFIATANAVSYCGAIPHFVDCELTTLGVDSLKLGDYLKETALVESDGAYNRLTGRRIRAIVPVHTFGHPVDLDPLLELCARYRLEMVEDAAEALGTYYKGRHAGTLGRIGIFSYNGNKIVTTGGGGCLVFQNPEDGRLAKHLSTTARRPHRWEYAHDAIGYNFRMPNLNAALGCAQLESLPRFLAAKRSLASAYRAAFQPLAGLRFVDEPAFARSNWWLNALLLDKQLAACRDELLERSNSAGVMTRPAWVLLHRLPMYSSCPRMDLSTAVDLEQRLVNIPSSVSRRSADPLS